MKKNYLEIWKLGFNLIGRRTNPCKINLIKKDPDNLTLKIFPKEIRNKQIRGIASSFFYKVVDIQRINFANISYDSLCLYDWKLIQKIEFEVI